MTEETRSWIWALVRIFLGAVQMTAALIGVGFLIATGASPLTFGMMLFAAACTALSVMLFGSQA